MRPHLTVTLTGNVAGAAWKQTVHVYPDWGLVLHARALAEVKRRADRRGLCVFLQTNPRG